MEIGAVSSLAASPEITGAASAAEEFEALVLGEFLKPLFDGAETSRLFGGEGAGSKAFGAMLQEQYAAAIAERGGVGIADRVMASLIDLQSQKTASKEAFR